MRGSGAEIRRVALAGDGSYVVVDSNFGVPEGYRVVMAEAGFGKKD